MDLRMRNLRTYTIQRWKKIVWGIMPTSTEHVLQKTKCRESFFECFLVNYEDFCTFLQTTCICNRLWSPRIYSEKSIPPAYVARQAGTKNRVVVLACQAGNRFLGSSNGLQIRAQWVTRDVVYLCWQMQGEGGGLRGLSQWVQLCTSRDI